MTTRSRKPGVFIKMAHHENNNDNDIKNKAVNNDFLGHEWGDNE